MSEVSEMIEREIALKLPAFKGAYVKAIKEWNTKKDGEMTKEKVQHRTMKIIDRSKGDLKELKEKGESAWWLFEYFKQVEQ